MRAQTRARARVAPARASARHVLEDFFHRHLGVEAHVDGHVDHVGRQLRRGTARVYSRAREEGDSAGGKGEGEASTTLPRARYCAEGFSRVAGARHSSAGGGGPETESSSAIRRASGVSDISAPRSRFGWVAGAWPAAASPICRPRPVWAETRGVCAPGVSRAERFVAFPPNIRIFFLFPSI